MVSNFFSSLMNRDYSPIGLDVGHEWIKMLQLRRRGPGWQVSASSLYSFADDARQNASSRWLLVGQAVGNLLSGPAGRQFRGRQVVACLDCEQVVAKNTRLPNMPASELVEAVKWEAADRFPFDTQTGLVRHVCAGEVRQGSETRQEVLMFAAPDAVLRDALRVLEQAGLNPLGLDVPPVALARVAKCFAAEESGQNVQAIVDIGGHSCQIVIVRDGQIVFFKNLELGSADLTKAIVEKVGTNAEDASSLRQRLGRPASASEPADESSKVYRALTAAMRPVVERLAQEILLCLRYYSVTFRGDRPTVVTAVGGGIHDTLLLKLLPEALGMEVRVGQPLAACQPDPVTCQWGDGPASGGPEWALAMGCCLKPVAKAAPRGAVAAAGAK